jgi:hypothetical protein
MDGAYHAVGSAVTVGSDEVYVSATNVHGVLRWDGQNWNKEPLEAVDGGLLTICGETVMLFTAGKANRRWQGLQWTRKSKVQCYHRSPAGEWEGPMDLTKREMTIHEYRGIPALVVPPYSPPQLRTRGLDRSNRTWRTSRQTPESPGSGNEASD